MVVREEFGAHVLVGYHGPLQCETNALEADPPSATRCCCPLLWEGFPGHANPAPAFDSRTIRTSAGQLRQKPRFRREGHKRHHRSVPPGPVSDTAGGIYGAGPMSGPGYSAAASSTAKPRIRGPARWVIEGQSQPGIRMREDERQLITQPTEQPHSCPHYFSNRETAHERNQPWQEKLWTSRHRLRAPPADCTGIDLCSRPRRRTPAFRRKSRRPMAEHLVLPPSPARELERSRLMNSAPLGELPSCRSCPPRPFSNPAPISLRKRGQEGRPGMVGGDFQRRQGTQAGLVAIGILQLRLAQQPRHVPYKSPLAARAPPLLYALEVPSDAATTGPF